MVVVGTASVGMSACKIDACYLLHHLINWQSSMCFVCDSIKIIMTIRAKKKRDCMEAYSEGVAYSSSVFC